MLRLSFRSLLCQTWTRDEWIKIRCVGFGGGWLVNDVLGWAIRPQPPAAPNSPRVHLQRANRHRLGHLFKGAVKEILARRDFKSIQSLRVDLFRTLARNHEVAVLR
jgi:hypothetical protein